MHLLTGAGDKGAARKRGGKGQNTDGGGGGDAPQMKQDSPQVSVEDVAVVQGDLSPQDPCVKCVRFSADLTLLLSGGADGFVRVWEVSFPLSLCTFFPSNVLVSTRFLSLQFPSLKEKFNFKAHNDELEDIDISHDKKVACVLFSEDFY